MAHMLARLVYRMLKFGEQSVDKGMQDYEENTGPTRLRASMRPITTSKSTPIPVPVIHRFAPDGMASGAIAPGMDGRNAFRGPGSSDQNLGAVKYFKIGERYDIQLKGEIINIWLPKQDHGLPTAQGNRQS